MTMTRPSSRPPAAGARVSLLDRDGAAAHLLPVHALDGVVHGCLVREVDEPEAFGPPRLVVIRHLGQCNFFRITDLI
jgi:hypothetical protein